MPLTPLSSLGGEGETMSEKTCCPNAQPCLAQLLCVCAAVDNAAAQWRKSELKRLHTQCTQSAQWQSRNVLGWSADALSTALLTQTELSITVRQPWLSQTEGELWTFGGAQTRAHEITPQKVSISVANSKKCSLKCFWHYF